MTAQLSRVLKFNSLKAKVVIATIGVVVVALLIVGAIQAHFTRAELARLIAKQQFTAVSHIAEDLDAKLDGDKNVLIRLAAELPVDRLRSPAALTAYIKEEGPVSAPAASRPRRTRYRPSSNECAPLSTG